MAVAKTLEDLQKQASCAICLEYYKDPVITECGHNFCRACITESWKDVYQLNCPECRVACQRSNLRPNRQLLSIAEIVRQFYKEAERRQEITTCEKHEEKMKFFCEEEQKAICVVCRESTEHKLHKVRPLEEAAEEYKKLLETEKRDRVAKFQKLHQALNEQENLFLKQLQEMNKKIVMTAVASLTNLSSNLSVLNKLKLDMRQSFTRPADRILMDMKSTLKRCEKADMEGPDGAKKKIKVSSEYLTFDAKTANRELMLSGDRRTVKRVDPALHLPDNHERFDTATCVISSEAFTSGTHYWEVDVRNGKFWALGVVSESVKRKGRMKETPEDGVWAIDRCDGYLWALSSPQERLSLAEKPSKVSVYLNYEEGNLSFYNGDTLEHIYSFLDNFEHKIHPYFWIGNKGELVLL
ncbi:E3 ubiquitin-protein ligase TRIM39-like isoform X2 [Ambystoma mexicanum]|uniref:E3 ubiquitin-protein ligase TRIM39-like isoform X2 n=1 Tax=Ambystoma mexicanum TaxID=8296 RepID=UPI0037E7B2C4